MDVVAIIIEVLLGLMFLMAGVMKISGAQMHVDNFRKWGLPQWFRVVTGLVELLGAAGMIVGIWLPAWAALAGIWLAVTMLGAVIVHIRVKDPVSQMAMSIILLLLSLAVVLLQRGELSNLY